MPVVSTAKMTAQQFLMLGDDPPGVRLELVDGEIAVGPSPRPRHSYPDRKLTYFLWRYIAQNDLGLLLGYVNTVFGACDVRRPDLIYLAHERMHLVRPDEAVDGPPDLCVEIVSPTSDIIDRKDKFRQYAKGGVPYYWIVDPRPQEIEAFRLSGGRYRRVGRGSGSDVVRLPPFPDLEIPLGKIWFPARRR